ncbi:hypothetical protein ACFVFS_17335 [Kitasatospora sp. NPDC057692]|uniref:hypothetical protein n=1 Tax=Kitasatospora sp. NPDC057692 TaxID=3346215 RepID=UPI0036CBA939
MKLKFEFAAAGSEIYAPNAFDGQVGKEIRVNLPGREATTGRVLEAKVAGSGRSVELTVEVSDTNLPLV